MSAAEHRVSPGAPFGVAATVMTHDETADTGAFDERRVGLDHLALRVADQDELQRWATHLEAKDVTHSGIIDIGFGPTIVLRDPDNMQLEFYVHQSTNEIQVNAADSEEARRALHEPRLSRRRRSSDRRRPSKIQWTVDTSG